MTRRMIVFTVVVAAVAGSGRAGAQVWNSPGLAAGSNDLGHDFFGGCGIAAGRRSF